PSGNGLSAWPDLADASHVGPHRFGNRHRPGSLLAVLDHRDERAAHRQPRAIECVAEVGTPAALRPILEIQTPRLKRLAVGARGDLAVLPLPRQPDLEIVALGGGEPHVARAVE